MLISWYPIRTVGSHNLAPSSYTDVYAEAVLLISLYWMPNSFISTPSTRPVFYANPHCTMDIAAEETSSPLQGFKYVKPFSNFFQAAKQRFANLDPESGVHLVGPMFELTACIDKEKR